MFCRWMTAAALVLAGVAVLSLGMALLEGWQAPGIYGQKVFCAAGPGEDNRCKGDRLWQDSVPCSAGAAGTVHTWEGAAAACWWTWGSAAGRP